MDQDAPASNQPEPPAEERKQPPWRGKHLDVGFPLGVECDPERVKKSGL